MRFRTKILLALAAVGVLPTAMVGGLSFVANRSELVATVGRMQLATVAEAARGCEAVVLRASEAFRLGTGYLPVGTLSRDELVQVLRLPLRQLPALDAIAVLDAKGNPVVPPLVRADASPRADLDAFARGIPLTLARKTGSAIGAPYRHQGPARVALANRVEGAEGRVIAAELSLDELGARLREIAQPGEQAYLLGPGGEVIASTGPSELSPEERGFLKASPTASVRVVHDRAGTAMLEAFAPLPQLGWGLLLAQPAAVAYGGTEHIKRYTLFWALSALLLMLVLELLLVRDLTGPLGQLSKAVHALANGQPAPEVELDGRDELGQLALAFNQMARELERRSAEVKAFNAELQQRVEARTAELKQAQNQIARTRHLAAIGSLGAGVAHELNNPVTSILGLVSMLKLKLVDGPYEETLRRMQVQVMRVAKIVSDLRTFTDQERGRGGQPFSLNQPVLRAVEQQLCSGERKGPTVRVHTAEDLPPVQGDPTQLELLVTHLLRNAIEATPDVGEVTVSTEPFEGELVRLVVADTGRGIPPELRERIFDPFFTTKSATRGVGLGLSIAASIVDAHHGSIRVESEEAKGTRFTITLPTFAAAHLA